MFCVCFPTHVSLHIRGIECQIICALCNVAEDELHLFMDCVHGISCQKEVNLWKSLDHWFHQSGSFSYLFFLNGKYIIINKQVSPQDEQKPVKEGLQTKAPYISGTPMKIPKHKPSNTGPFLISFLEIHSPQLPNYQRIHQPDPKIRY
jgi:hypothetical protein